MPKVDPLDNISAQSSLRKHICRQKGCTKSYKTAFCLRRHQMTHDPSAKPVSSIKLECPEVGCDKSYDTLSHLRRHIRIIHEEAETRESKRVACVIPGCNKMFHNRCSMKRHIKTQHDETNPSSTYNCDQCNKEFENKIQLRSHYIIHTGKMHKCNHCPGFVYTPHFRPDNPTQTVFPCTEENCLKFYYHETNLVTHFHTRHTPTYGFECDLCGQRFWEKRAVKRHLNKHLRQAVDGAKHHQSQSQSSDNQQTPPVELIIPEELTSKINKMEANAIKTETVNSSSSPNIGTVICTSQFIKQEPMDNENSENLELSRTEDMVCKPHFIKLEPLGGIKSSEDEHSIVNDQVYMPHFIKLEPLVDITIFEGNTHTENLDEIVCTENIKIEPFEMDKSDDDDNRC